MTPYISEKTYTCKRCNETGLYWTWNRQTRKPYLIKEGVEHNCQQLDSDIKPAKGCRYCDAKNLFWAQKANGRYELIEEYGLQHTCKGAGEFMKDWAAALREDYAFEKARLKAIPDSTICKKCKGLGYKTYTVRNKKMLDKEQELLNMRVIIGPVRPKQISKFCKVCKGMGIYSSEKKASFLKQLRKRYWPFNSSRHTWKKYTP